jgi:hypothetical protein
MRIELIEAGRHDREIGDWRPAFHDCAQHLDLVFREQTSSTDRPFARQSVTGPRPVGFRRSIASKKATRSAGALKRRTAGKSTKVTKATPPVQRTTAST